MLGLNRKGRYDGVVVFSKFFDMTLSVCLLERIFVKSCWKSVMDFVTNHVELFWIVKI